MTTIVEIERIQKSAFAVIFQNESQSYKEVLKKFNLKPLDERRDDIFRKFAHNVEKHPIFSEWLAKNPSCVNTRKPLKYIEDPCRTERWKQSSIPILTSILNMSGKPD